MNSSGPRLRGRSWLLLAMACASLRCGGPPSAGTGASPPTPVECVRLELAPIERTTDFIAVVKSRRSSTLQPMVEGIVTRIFVRSGDRVRRGDPILELDSSRQDAALAALESLRAAREADLLYARREAERQRTLHEAGAASAQEAELAESALENAEAQLRAIEAEIRERKVELGYTRVTAPTAGIVGDIPVRVGDRVTTSTVLTTIDAGGGLELYVRVPVRHAADLARGKPVRILDDAGATLLETAFDFVSPQVDVATQTVLAKAPLPEGAGFRPEQQVRARVVWRSETGLRIPVVAVTRIGGKSFAYVAEGEGSAAVARQKGIELGPIVGNDYVVVGGLSPGELLVLSGVQKIRDGSPIEVRLVTPAAGGG